MTEYPHAAIQRTGRWSFSIRIVIDGAGDTWRPVRVLGGNVEAWQAIGTRRHAERKAAKLLATYREVRAETDKLIAGYRERINGGDR